MYVEAATLTGARMLRLLGLPVGAGDAEPKMFTGGSFHPCCAGR